MLNKEELFGLPNDKLVTTFGQHLLEICDNAFLKTAEQIQNFAIVSAALFKRDYAVLAVCQGMLQNNKSMFEKQLLPFPTNADTVLEIITTKKSILEYTH